MIKVKDYFCLQCGKKFQSYPCEERRGGAKFCSKQCGYDNKKRRMMKICEVCGENFEVRIYEVSRGKGRFCSKNCKAKVMMSYINKGRKFTEEHRKKIGDANRGENNSNWKGGKRTVNMEIRKSFDMTNWRYYIFRRDDYTCQRCLARNGQGKKIILHAHHIIPFAVAPEEHFESSNGATLCEDCHSWVHKNELNIH